MFYSVEVPVTWMTENVLVALIQGLASVIVAIIGVIGVAVGAWKKWGKPWVEGIRSDIAETKHEVKNTHSINLRDDLDGKFEQVLSEVERSTKASHLAQGWAEAAATEARANTRLVSGIESRLDQHLEESAPIWAWVRSRQAQEEPGEAEA